MTYGLLFSNASITSAWYTLVKLHFSSKVNKMIFLDIQFRTNY